MKKVLLLKLYGVDDRENQRSGSSCFKL